MYGASFSGASPTFVAAEPQKHGGSPCIYAGEERFSAGHFLASHTYLEIKTVSEIAPSETISLTRGTILR